MTRSNKTPKNPAKSTIKSLKSVTNQKRTWRKWHNRRGLLARQAADERRHDRLLGRFDIIHHVTTTRSRFCVTFFVPTSVAANPLHQPVISTRYVNQSSTCHSIRSALQSIPSVCFISRWSLLFNLFVILLVITTLSEHLSPCYCIDETRR